VRPTALKSEVCRLAAPSRNTNRNSMAGSSWYANSPASRRNCSTENPLADHEVPGHESRTVVCYQCSEKIGGNFVYEANSWRCVRLILFCLID
jgi:hypothetical protein